ncbi:uncharacterized protein N7483_006617 [Penicillium malachiteum]|uniref:uncharacterized protein n=1 Tax=Penicillium malachiteum TaxID=1324776 RepID=UPI0025491AA0|nr:uncharacterized protein N7483_006617 [Penicillium malachiteum]KAJ5725260.1 hypothetical protein N7483_006617 [Penicillium malachiteum]
MGRAKSQDRAICQGYAIGMAAWAPGVELLKQILNAGADVNQSLESEYWPSVLAIKIDLQEVESIEFLVQEAGAAPDMTFKIGPCGSPLVVACLADCIVDIQYRIMESLLNGGADMNMPLEYGRFGSALAAGVWRYYAAGADVNMFLENRDFSTAITFSVAVPRFERPRREIMALLVKAGAELNPKGSVRRYGGALMAASCFGQEEKVQFLIDAGADVNQRFEGIPYATALQAAQADFSEKDWEWVLYFIDNFGYCDWNGDFIWLEEDELKPFFKRRKDRIACLLKENGAIACFFRCPTG